MVTMKRAAALSIFMTLAGMVAASPAVRAQSVLEQMENEVANIAAHTKSAVVTIFDRTPREASAALFNGVASRPDYRVERVYETPEETKKRGAAQKDEIRDMGVAYFNLDVAETGARAELKELRKKYAEDHPLVLAQQEKVKGLQKQRDAALKKLNARKAAIAAPQVIQLRVFRSPDAPSSAATGNRAGSGFSIGDGYIVTTADVLDGMKDPLVTTDSGIQVRAQIVGVNKEWNVGLLKLSAKVDVPALRLGDSAKVNVGHFAISVGEQSGQSNSVALLLVGGLRTDGVSAGGHFYPNLIQIAGTVGAGISGAPLVNSRGEVIGIMAGVPAAPQSVYYSQSKDGAGLPYTSPSSLGLPDVTYSVGKNPYVLPPDLPANQHMDALPKKDDATEKRVPVLGDMPSLGQLYRWNVSANAPSVNLNVAPFGGAEAAPVTSAGFAVPINALRPILDELKSGKAVAKGWIGISPKDDVTTTETERVVYTHRRVIVEGLYPGSPAFVAGILPGDEIVRVNGTPVQSANDVREISQGLRAGNVLKVLLRRGPDPLTGKQVEKGRLNVVRRLPDGYEAEATLVITERPATFGEPRVLPKEKD